MDDLILIVVSIGFSVYIYQQVLVFSCAGNYPTNIPIKIIFITNITTRETKKNDHIVLITLLSPESISLLVTFNGNNWRVNWFTVNGFSTFEVPEDSNAVCVSGVYKMLARYERAKYLTFINRKISNLLTHIVLKISQKQVLNTNHRRASAGRLAKIKFVRKRYGWIRPIQDAEKQPSRSSSAHCILISGAAMPSVIRVHYTWWGAHEPGANSTTIE